LPDNEFVKMFLAENNLEITSKEKLRYVNTAQNKIIYGELMDETSNMILSTINKLKEFIIPEEINNEVEQIESDYFKILYFLDLEILAAGFSTLGKASMPDRQKPKSFVEVEEIKAAVKTVENGGHLISADDFGRIKYESSQSSFYDSQNEYGHMFDSIRVTPNFKVFIDYMAALYGKYAKKSKFAFKQKVINDLIVFAAFFDAAVKKAMLEKLTNSGTNTNVDEDTISQINSLREELGAESAAIYNFSFHEIMEEFAKTINYSNGLAVGTGLLNVVIPQKNNGTVQKNGIFPLANDKEANINNLMLIGRTNSSSTNVQAINAIQRFYSGYSENRKAYLRNPGASLLGVTLTKSNYAEYSILKENGEPFLSFGELLAFQKAEEFFQKILSLSIFQSGISSSPYNLIKILPANLVSPIVERGVDFLNNYLNKTLENFYDAVIINDITLKDLMPSIFKLWFFMANPSFANKEKVFKAKMINGSEATPVVLKFAKSSLDGVYEKSKYTKSLSFCNTLENSFAKVDVLGDFQFKNFSSIISLMNEIISGKSSSSLGVEFLLQGLLQKVAPTVEKFSLKKTKSKKITYREFKSEDLLEDQKSTENYYIFYVDNFNDKFSFVNAQGKQIDFASDSVIIGNKNKTAIKIKIGLTNPNEVGKKPSGQVVKLKAGINFENISIFKVAKVIGNYSVLLADNDANFDAFKENVESVLNTLKNVTNATKDDATRKSILFPMTVADAITTVPKRFAEYLQKRLKEVLEIKSELIIKEGFYTVDTDFNDKFPPKRENIEQLKKNKADRIEQRAYLKVLGVGEELIRDPNRFEETVEEKDITSNDVENNVVMPETKENEEVVNYATVFEGQNKESFIIYALSNAIEHVNKTGGTIHVDENIHKSITMDMYRRSQAKRRDINLGHTIDEIKAFA